MKTVIVYLFAALVLVSFGANAGDWESIVHNNGKTALMWVDSKDGYDVKLSVYENGVTPRITHFQCGRGGGSDKVFTVNGKRVSMECDGGFVAKTVKGNDHLIKSFESGTVVIDGLVTKTRGLHKEYNKVMEVITSEIL